MMDVFPGQYWAEPDLRGRLRLNKTQSGSSETKQQFALPPGWYAASIAEIRGKSGAYAYFLEMQPVAMVGYSFYIYHVR